MISVTDLRNGTKVKMDGALWRCIEYQHQKIGRGGAKVVAKFRNLETGAIVERSFNSGEKLEDIYVETKDLQYLYSEGDELVFMDLETYEQFHVPRSISENTKFLKEGMTVQGAMYNGRPLEITLPASVELRVIDTPPGVRGDTVSGGTKPATLETGAVVQCRCSSKAGRLSRWIPAAANIWAAPEPHPNKG